MKSEDAPDVASNRVVQGAHPNTWCNIPGANIWEHHGNDWWLFQQTYYCWSKTGYGVYSLGYGNLQAWSGDRAVSWIQPIDKQFTQCYPWTYPNGYTMPRGYCDQTSFGHFRVFKSGGVNIDILGTGGGASATVDHNVNIWTMVRIWYNGAAQCANSHDATWDPCDNSAR